MAVHLKDDKGGSSDDPQTPLLKGDDGQKRLWCGCTCCGGDCVWGLAEQGKNHLDGHKREVSKGGSPHMTDETFNTMSHLVGLMMSILGLATLVAAASSQGKVWHIVAFAVYGSSLVLLFLASTLHHGVHSTPGVEKALLLLDYMAIFPLIAGSFTPFCLVLLHDHWSGWVFFGTTWGLALVGMLLVGCLQEKLPRWISFTIYMTMGWMGVALAWFIFPKIGWLGLGLLATSGILYSVGGYVFVSEVPNPYPGVFGFHEIWHVFVLAASMVLWFCMYFTVLPYSDATNTA